MNMVRVSGVTCYPGEAFYRHCDEAGLMVWQDFMFANFDYGDDPEFMEAAAREVGQWLVSTGAHPSVAVLCGGSEAEQQAAMLGTARADWRQPLFDALIPRLVSEHRPDAVYVPTPSGGAWPFQPDTGVSHYYGVGPMRGRWPTHAWPMCASPRNAWPSPTCRARAPWPNTA